MNAHFRFASVAAIGFWVVVFLFVAVTLVHGSWTEPFANPVAGNVGSPLTISPLGQIKQGGLGLNYPVFDAGMVYLGGGTGDFGLLVPQGLVAIGATPAERLEVGGNMRITNIAPAILQGIIKPNNNAGLDDQVITRTASGMDWNNKEAWLTVVGNFSFSTDAGCASQPGNPVTPPPPCPSGWIEYQTYCGHSGNPPIYAIWYRTCFQ